MTGQEMKSALAEGQTLCGTLIVSPSPKWLKYVGDIGLDYVFIDTEHVSIDDLTLSWMCMAYDAKGLVPIVRIPAAEPYLASRMLDAGAKGILVPYVETAEQARRMAGAVAGKPLKGRYLQDWLDGKALPEETVKALAEASSEHMLFLNIESIPAIEALDEILAVPGVDGVIVGPNDLSFSMGCPNDYSSPEFEEAIVGIMKRVREKGLAAGCHFLGSIDRQIEWARRSGMNLLLQSGDLYAFVDGLKGDVARYKRILGLDRTDTQSARTTI